MKEVEWEKGNRGRETRNKRGGEGIDGLKGVGEEMGNRQREGGGRKSHGGRSTVLHRPLDPPHTGPTTMPLSPRAYTDSCIRNSPLSSSSYTQHPSRHFRGPTNE